ncbi:hypothetical protein [Streptomyces sp. NPDC016845]|uniref:hypothetical protein n=1 Tax=Streptomyces sp. NPDC016845 TaxID=3364972 RepID=UPI00378FF684
MDVVPRAAGGGQRQDAADLEAELEALTAGCGGFGRVEHPAVERQVHGRLVLPRAVFVQ